MSPNETLQALRSALEELEEATADPHGIAHDVEPAAEQVTALFAKLDKFMTNGMAPREWSDD